MLPRANPLPNKTTDFGNCGHHFILDGICECLEKRQCRFAYSYGGDVFCKHPFVAQWREPGKSVPN